MLDWQNISSWRLLLIDDEPDNLEVVAESLEFYGISVETATNGQIGLEKVETFTPTLILLDLSMPVMDGWQTLRRLKSNPRMEHTPIIALSAHAIVGDEQRALNAGFDGYLTKPVNIPTLIEDLRAALQKQGEIKQ
jgi:two-component system cell cycle response regulator DivK